ncbi:MAG: hypothetical protein J3K34DRAFT_395696 [Monoraphidium minutum]|nr:MAG: hypothetical protein J3K34DRAFT_395696 [Monoraphidium minutum]
MGAAGPRPQRSAVVARVAPARAVRPHAQRSVPVQALAAKRAAQHLAAVEDALRWGPKRHCSPARRVGVRAITAAEFYATQPLPTLAHGAHDAHDAREGTGEGEGEHAAAGAETALVAPGPAGPTALAALPEHVDVQFVVPQYYTSYGQVLKVVGALEELGSWSPDKAPAMTWNEHHMWTLDMKLPVGETTFKVVMQDEWGGLRWEDGSDRTITLDAATEAAPGEAAPVGSVGVACSWGDTRGTGVVARPDKAFLAARLAALEARVAALRQKRVRAEEHAAARALAASAPHAEAAAAAPVHAGGAMLQVALVEPSQLPAIGGKDGGDDAMAAAEARFNALLSEIVAGGDAGAAPAVSPESVSERVLAATVEHLVAAAAEALARDVPAGAVALGAECEVARAAAFLGELQAATAALEHEGGAPFGAEAEPPLLAFDHAAMDVDAAPPPPPSLHEVVAAAAGAPKPAGAHPELAQEHAWTPPAPIRVQPAEAAAAATEDRPQSPPAGPKAMQAAHRWRSAVGRVLAEAQAAEERGAAGGDGSLVFSAASLSLEVDPQELLKAALERARARLAQHTPAAGAAPGAGDGGTAAAAAAELAVGVVC